MLLINELTSLLFPTCDAVNGSMLLAVKVKLCVSCVCFMLFVCVL